MLSKRKIKQYREVIDVLDVDKEPELAAAVLLSIITQTKREFTRRLKKLDKVCCEETIEMRFEQ